MSLKYLKLFESFDPDLEEALNRTKHFDERVELRIDNSNIIGWYGREPQGLDIRKAERYVKIFLNELVNRVEKEFYGGKQGKAVLIDTGDIYIVYKGGKYSPILASKNDKNQKGNSFNLIVAGDNLVTITHSQSNDSKDKKINKIKDHLKRTGTPSSGVEYKTLSREDRAKNIMINIDKSESDLEVQLTELFKGEEIFRTGIDPNFKRASQLTLYNPKAKGKVFINYPVKFKENKPYQFEIVEIMSDKTETSGKSITKIVLKGTNPEIAQGKPFPLTLEIGKTIADNEGNPFKIERIIYSERDGYIAFTKKAA